MLVRDEQGNMRVVHDWHRGDQPTIWGHDDCASLASRIRSAYPNATHGLEFAYYYTGDDRSSLQNTEKTPAYDQLPNFRAFLFTGGPHVPDQESPRVPLERTAPTARLLSDIQKELDANAENTDPLLSCGCGWAGDLNEAADYDAESIYCIDWTCPSCGSEGMLPTGAGEIQLPINAEA